MSRTLAMDMRIAFRSLVRQPGFLVTSVLTLALAISANVAVYAMVQGVLLRPLGYTDSEELVVVWPSLWASKAHFAWMERELDSLKTIAAFYRA